MTSVFRRLKFSLRSLLVAVTGIGAMLGWVTWQWQVVRARQALWPRMNQGPFSVRVIGVPGSAPRHIPWLRVILGDFPEANLIYDPTSDPRGEQLRQARELFPEATIWGWPGQRSLPTGVQPLPEGQPYRI